MDIGGEKNNELTGSKRQIVEIFFRQGIEGHVFPGIIRSAGGLVSEWGVAEFFCAGNDDLDVCIVPVAFRIAFGEGFGGVFVDNGEDVIAVDRLFACFEAGEIGMKNVLDGFFEVWADDPVPMKLIECRGNHTDGKFRRGR